MVEAFARLGFIGEGANMVAIERGMSLMMGHYYGLTLGEVRELDIPEVAHDVDKLLYGQPFQIPAQFAFIGRAIGTLVGVSTGLAPDFNFVEVATPYARKFLGLDLEGARETAEQIFQQLLEAGRILLSLPRSLDQLIYKIETGQIEIKTSVGLDSGGPRRRGRRRGNNANAASSGSGTLSWLAMFVVSLAGGIVLTDVHQIIASWIFLGLAGLTGLRLLLKR